MTFVMLTLSWRASFYILGVVTAVWVAVWWDSFRDDPRTHRGVTPADIAEIPEYRQMAAKGDSVPWGTVIARMMPTMIVYFCYGWTSWLFFSWLPTFFLHGYELDLKNTAIFSSAVFFAGMVGDTVGGVLSDRILRRAGNVNAACRNVIMGSLLGAFVFLMPVVFSNNFTVITVRLSAALSRWCTRISYSQRSWSATRSKMRSGRWQPSAARPAPSCTFWRSRGASACSSGWMLSTGLARTSTAWST